MKVTLVYVGIGVAGFNANRPLGDREGSWISHGVASVGASAKKAGYAVDLIDLRRLSGWDDFEKTIKASPSDVYGLSVSSVDAWHALKAVLVIKKALPDARIVVGGIHPTIFPGEYDYKAIDCVVQGEGEISFAKVLEDIEGGRPIKKIVGGTKPDLNAIPWVDRELFDYKNELNCNFTPDQKRPSITMLAGRGCPYKCTYCQPAENAVFGKPYRLRAVDNVIAEMAYLKDRYGYKSCTFWDDTFTFNRKWVKEFCDSYEASKINVPLVVCSRADIICENEGMVERLSEIGVKWFVVGMESGSQRLLDLVKKGTTVEQNIQAGKICKKHGVNLFATFMFGLPTETRQDSLATARMIDELRPEHSSPFWFIPIPGTEIYDHCDKNGLILDSARDRTIERTNKYMPTIKGVDYGYIDLLMKGHREGAPQRG